jgi:hypothetical protein
MAQRSPNSWIAHSNGDKEQVECLRLADFIRERDVVVDAAVAPYVTIEWASPAFFFFFNTGYSETRVGNGRRHATRANQ